MRRMSMPGRRTRGRSADKTEFSCACVRRTTGHDLVCDQKALAKEGVIAATAAVPKPKVDQRDLGEGTFRLFSPRTSVRISVSDRNEVSSSGLHTSSVKKVEKLPTFTAMFCVHPRDQSGMHVVAGRRTHTDDGEIAVEEEKQEREPLAAALVPYPVVLFAESEGVVVVENGYEG